MKKIVYFLFPFLFLACTPKEKPVNDLLNGKNRLTAEDGKKLFFRNCSTCHGTDGTLGFSGAKDLSVSTLKDDEIIEMIINGKNGMMPYKTILKTDEERRVVKDFVKTLRQ